MPYFHQLDSTACENGYLHYPHGKFWYITRTDCSLNISFGNIKAGEPRTSSKTFATPDKAQKEYDKLVRQKLASGYVRPDIFDEPTGEIEWSEEMLSARPVMRGINAPLTLTLTPFESASVLTELKGYNDSFAWYQGNDIVVDLGLLQAQIKTRLAGYSTPVSFEDWVNCPLLHIYPSHRGNMLLSKEGCQTLFTCLRAFFERAILMLGPLLALELLLDYSHRLINRVTSGVIDALLGVLDIMRNTLAAMDDDEYHQAREAAGRVFITNDDNLTLHAVICFLFPTEDSWSAKLIAKLKSQPFMQRKLSVYNPESQSHAEYFQQLAAMAEKPSVRGKVMPPFTLRLRPFEERMLQIQLKGYRCDEYKSIDFYLDLAPLQEQIIQQLEDHGDNFPANPPGIKCDWIYDNLFKYHAKMGMPILTPEDGERVAEAAQAFMERAIFMYGPLTALSKALEYFDLVPPEEVLHYRGTLALFRHLLGTLPAPDYSRAVQIAKERLIEAYRKGGLIIAIRLMFMTECEWPHNIAEVLKSPDFLLCWFQSREERDQEERFTQIAPLLETCRLNPDNYVWLVHKNYMAPVWLMRQRVALWLACLGQHSLPVLIDSLTMHSNCRQSKAEYERSRQNRETILTAILTLQSDQAIKGILKNGGDETTLHFIYILASRYPLYLKGLLENGDYGLSEYDARRLRQFIEMVIS